MGFFSRKKAATTAELLQQLMTQRRAGQLREAAETAGTLDQQLRKEFGERHVSVANNLRVLGELRLELKDGTGAGPPLEQALAIWQATLGASHGTCGVAMARLGQQRLLLGRVDEARELAEKASAILLATSFGPKHPDYGIVRDLLAALPAAKEAASPVSPVVAASQPEPPLRVTVPLPPAVAEAAGVFPDIATPDLQPAWKTVRVFLSSTFRDMHAERDHLVKVAFPRLRQWCAGHRLHLVDIDLRWGVTREEADNGKAIEICLQEIDGSRPFFVCILGERYGWVPDVLPQEERFTWHSVQAATGCSITHLEIVHATDRSLSADDGGRLPPAQHAFFYLRARDAVPADTGDGRAVHNETFFEQAPALADRLAALKTWIRDRFSAAGRVTTYTGRWDAAAINPEDASLTGRLVDLDAFGERVTADLQRAIAEQFPRHVAGTGVVDPVVEERARHEAFIELRTRVHVRRRQVEDALTAYVESNEARPLVLSGVPGCGKSAVIAHWLSMWSLRHADAFVVVRFIGASAASTNLHGLLSSIATELVQRLRLTEPAAHDNGGHAVPRPMEVPVDINALREKWPAILAAAGRVKRVVLLIDALDQLDRSGSPSTSAWLLHSTPPGVRLVTSAVEAMGTTGGTGIGSWLLTARRLEVPEIRVPALSEDDCRQLIAELPSVFCKRLDPAQVALLLANGAARNPLFLTVALEELRTFGSFERLGDAIRALPQLSAEHGDVESAIEALFGQILDRLDREAGRDAGGFVRNLFTLLASAREGMSEEELDGVLAARHASMPATRRTGAMQVVLRQVRPHLMRKGASRTVVVDFFHESFRRAVRAKYLDDKARHAAHRDLAGFFGAQPNWLAEGERTPNERKALELPWHLVRCARFAAPDARDAAWDELAGPLASVDFIAAKVAAGHIVDLQADYMAALSEWAGEASRDMYDDPADPVSADEVLAAMRQAESGAPSQALTGNARSAIGEFAAFVSSRAHLLGAFPREVLAVARNYAANGAVARGAAELADAQKHLWIARDPRPNAPPATPLLVRTIPVSSGALLAATPDARNAASTDGSSVMIWNTSTGERRRTLTGSSGPTRALSMSADGSIVAVATGKSGLLGSLMALTGGRGASKEGPPSVRVWNVASGELMHQLEMTATSLSLNWDGSRAAIVNEGALDVWDLASGRRMARLLSEGATRAVLTPDGNHLLSAHSDRTARLWQLPERAERVVLRGHGEAIAALALTPDAQWAVTGTGSGSLASAEQTVRVWHLSSGRAVATFASDAGQVTMGDTRTFFGKAQVTGVAVSSDGRIVVGVGADSLIRVWDVRSGQLVRSLRGPAGFSHVVATASGRSALTADDDGAMRLWNLERGGIEQDLPRHEVRADADSPLPPDIAAIAPPREMLGALQTNAANAIVLAPTGTSAWSAGDDATARRWNIATGECEVIVRGHPVPVNDVALWRDGNALTAATDNTIGVWDQRGERVRVLSGHTGAVHAVAVAPDGRTALSGASGMGQVPFADHSVRLWDLEKGACLRLFLGHGHWVRGVALSPDVRLAASGSTDGTIRLWDLDSGAEKRSIAPRAGHVERVVFSPNGRLLAAATQHGALLLIDVRDGTVLRTLTNHRARANGVGWSSDGSTLVSASEDGTVRVWNVATGESTGVYPAGSPVRSVSGVRADGRFGCGTIDGRVHFLALRGHVSSAPVATSRHALDGGTVPDLDCPWCGASFPLPVAAHRRVDYWTAYLSQDQTAVDLPDAAFADDQLTISCGACQQAMRVNPFVARRPDSNLVDWHNDPALAGRFHQQAPDDVQVLVHDGHPGYTGRSAERIWVRMTGRRDRAWTGKLLNQPFHLTSVSQGDEILFLAKAGFADLIHVTPKYLGERGQWKLQPCNKCGMPEAFQPPSELIEHTDVPANKRSEITQLTAPCPMCDGVQVFIRSWGI